MSAEPRPARPAPTRWLMWINRGCGLAAGFALLVMMLVGAADVVGTNLDLLGLRSFPLPAVFEFMATLMVVNVFLAMSLGQARRHHIRVEVLINFLPGSLRAAAEVFQSLLCAAFFALVAWFGWKSGIHSTSVGEFAPGIINYPVYPARLVLAFGASLMTVQCFFDLLSVLAPRLSSEDRLAERGVDL